MVISVTPGICLTDSSPGQVRGTDRDVPDIEHLGTEFSTTNRPAPPRSSRPRRRPPGPHGVFAATCSPPRHADRTRPGGAQADVAVVASTPERPRSSSRRHDDVQALVVQEPYGIGYQAVQQAIAAVNGDRWSPRSPPTSSWPPPTTSRIPRSTSSCTRRSATESPDMSKCESHVRCSGTRDPHFIHGEGPRKPIGAAAHEVPGMGVGPARRRAQAAVGHVEVDERRARRLGSWWAWVAAASSSTECGNAENAIGTRRRHRQFVCRRRSGTSGCRRAARTPAAR